MAELLGDKETAPITDTSAGSVIVWVPVIRDSGGNITSGSVDFDVSTKFSTAVTVTGLHIHKGVAGVAGSIVIPTDVSSIAVDPTGKGRVQKKVQFPAVAPATEPAVNTIQHLLNNPQNFYANIHTTDNK